jgi:hypothetical protein
MNVAVEPMTPVVPATAPPGPVTVNDAAVTEDGRIASSKVVLMLAFTATSAAASAGEVESTDGDVSSTTGGVPPLDVTLTATQSRRKSRLVLVATSMTLTRKFALSSSDEAQVRPHVSVEEPRI